MRLVLAVAGVVLLLGAGCGDDGVTLDPGGDTAQDDATADAAEAPSPDVQVGADSQQTDDTDDVGPPPEWLGWPVDAPGPYGAGYRTVEVTYEPDGAPSPRTLKVSLWYPTEDESGADVAYLDIFYDDDVFLDASLAPPVHGETYPVHLHSHGHLGFAGSSPFLMRHFATHGWVVIAPDHTNNTLVDNIDPRPAWMYSVRGQDLSATLDAMGELPSDDPLAGKLALDAVIGSGHSFGGYTLFGVAGATFDVAAIDAGCADGSGPAGVCSAEESAAFHAGVVDARVVAAMPLAAGNHALYGAAGLADVAVPVLMMSGDDDQSVQNATEGDPIWAALPAPAIRVDVAGGCHQLWALGGCELISDADGLPIVDAYTMAFARHHLLGDASNAALLGGSEVYGEAHVTVSVK